MSPESSSTFTNCVSCESGKVMVIHALWGITNHPDSFFCAHPQLTDKEALMCAKQGQQCRWEQAEVENDIFNGENYKDLTITFQT